MSRLLLFLLLPLAYVPLSPAAVYVVVNEANRSINIDRDELAAFFLGKRRTFPNGEIALVVERGKQSDVRAEFFFALNKMSLSRINAYWSRLTFSGRIIPPSVVEQDDDLLQVIATNSNAISYVDFIPKNPKVSIVYTFDGDNP